MQDTRLPCHEANAPTNTCPAETPRPQRQPRWRKAVYPVLLSSSTKQPHDYKRECYFSVESLQFSLHKSFAPIQEPFDTAASPLPPGSAGILLGGWLNAQPVDHFALHLFLLPGDKSTGEGSEVTTSL